MKPQVKKTLNFWSLIVMVGHKLNKSSKTEKLGIFFVWFSDISKSDLYKLELKYMYKPVRKPSLTIKMALEEKNDANND